MSNKKTEFNKTIDINGMHCRSCEILIEQELSKLEGVTKVKANEKKGVAHISCTSQVPDSKLDDALRKVGYTLGREERGLISKNIRDYRDLLFGLILLAVLYIVGNNFGLFDFALTRSANYSSLPVVFLIGLTAGLSTCMALVGGLVLAVSSRFAEKNKNLSGIAKFKPHLWFNLGRVVVFFIFGGLLGLVGSVFQISLSLVGLLTVFVGFTMLLLGLQTIDIFYFLDKIKLTLPKGLYKILGIKNKTSAEYTNRSSFILGGLTFFLPCGFTQAMQLFAMTSGNMLTGALTMSIFALGTTPGLLSVGGLTSVIKQKTAKTFFRFIGLLVIALSIYNIKNGLNLAGVNISFASSVNNNEIGMSKVDTKNTNNVQMLKATYTAQTNVQPRSFTVKAGQPVRLEVLAKDDGYGCMGSLAIPGLVRKYEIFKKGVTAVMEFTPTKKGTYQITCAMGVPHGTLTVN